MQTWSLPERPVLESNFLGRKWWGLRTTDLHWHYVEWANGSVELYDLFQDPWEMENRVSDSTLTEIRSRPSSELSRLKTKRGARTG